MTTTAATATTKDHTDNIQSNISGTGGTGGNSGNGGTGGNGGSISVAWILPSLFFTVVPRMLLSPVIVNTKLAFFNQRGAQPGGCRDQPGGCMSTLVYYSTTFDVSAAILGVLCAAPLGALSDSLGRKPFIVATGEYSSYHGICVVVVHSVTVAACCCCAAAAAAVLLALHLLLPRM